MKAEWRVVASTEDIELTSLKFRLGGFKFEPVEEFGSKTHSGMARISQQHSKSVYQRNKFGHKILLIELISESLVGLDSTSPSASEMKNSRHWGRPRNKRRELKSVEY